MQLHPKSDMRTWPILSTTKGALRVPPQAWWRHLRGAHRELLGPDGGTQKTPEKWKCPFEAIFLIIKSVLHIENMIVRINCCHSMLPPQIYSNKVTKSLPNPMRIKQHGSIDDQVHKLRK